MGWAEFGLKLHFIFKRFALFAVDAVDLQHVGPQAEVAVAGLVIEDGGGFGIGEAQLDQILRAGFVDVDLGGVGDFQEVGARYFTTTLTSSVVTSAPRPAMRTTVACQFSSVFCWRAI